MPPQRRHNATNQGHHNVRTIMRNQGHHNSTTIQAQSHQVIAPNNTTTMSSHYHQNYTTIPSQYRHNTSTIAPAKLPQYRQTMLLTRPPQSHHNSTTKATTIPPQYRQTMVPQWHHNFTTIPLSCWFAVRRHCGGAGWVPFHVAGTSWTLRSGAVMCLTLSVCELVRFQLIISEICCGAIVRRPVWVGSR